MPPQEAVRGPHAPPSPTPKIGMQGLRHSLPLNLTDNFYTTSKPHKRRENAETYLDYAQKSL